jgi:Pretoxin HINT domain
VIYIALACAGLFFGEVADSPRSPVALKTYEALRRKAGREPAAHVKLALWCEAHGLDAERLKHLSIALLSDPKSTAARGLLGLVEYSGQWKTTEQLREQLKSDDAFSAKRAEYERRRAKLTSDVSRSPRSQGTKPTDGPNEAGDPARLISNRRIAQAHVELALWCDRNGLKPEAMAHFMTAIHLDPDRDSTWKHLGYVKRGGRWTSPDLAASQDREERAQKQADRYWEPLLKKWKAWLVEKGRRVEAEQLLAAVTDRRALASMLRVFPKNGSEPGQTRLVRLLGQIDDPSSSRVLAAQAIGTRFDSVRLEAINILKGRPPRDYAALLVEMIHGTVRYEVRPVSGPNSQGALAIDAPRFRMLRTYDVPPAFELHSSFRGYVGYDANGLPIVVSGRELDSMRAFAANPEAVAAKIQEVELRTASLLAMATETARRQMAADIYAIEANNQQVRDDNASIMPVLKMAAGAPVSLGDDEDAWRVWWYDTLGYSYQAAPKPTVAQDATPQYFAPYIRTCFAAGTLVHTLSGARPIEAIQVGDRVLSQDVGSGALSLQPVVFVHHNPPGKTLRIRLSGGDSVVCSVYHRFWRANLGWAQARELKPGDVLRHINGIVRVASVTADSTQPLFNLDVANSRTFFVGRNQLLVHDNTLPDHRLVPFDALPAQIGQ